MNEMVKRVARAICLADATSEDRWEEYEAEARAAIAAMREPSEEMVAAATDAEASGWDYLSSRECEEAAPLIWDAMIDAALFEGTV